MRGEGEWKLKKSRFGIKLAINCWRAIVLFGNYLKLKAISRERLVSFVFVALFMRSLENKRLVAPSIYSPNTSSNYLTNRDSLAYLLPSTPNISSLIVLAHFR